MHLGIIIRRLGKTAGLILPAFYLPYIWLLLIDYPWNGYRLYWLSLWPALPGLLSIDLFRRFTDVSSTPTVEYTVAAVTTGMLILLTFAIAIIGRRTRWFVTAAVAAFSIINSVIAYSAFRA